MHKRYFWLLTMRTFRKMLLSNALAMLLPLVFSLVLYTWFVQLYSAQISRINQSSLDQMKQTLDERIESLVVAANQLSMNEDVTSISSYSGRIQPQQHLKMLQLQNYMAQMASADAFIREIYLYFPKSGYVLSNVGRYADGELNRLATSRFGLDGERLRALILEAGYRDIRLIRLPESTQADTVLLRQRIHVNHPVEPAAHVLLLGERKVLRAMLASQRWQNSSLLSIQSADGQFVSEPQEMGIGKDSSAMEAFKPPFPPGDTLTTPTRVTVGGMPHVAGQEASRHGLTYSYLIRSVSYGRDMSRVLWVGLAYLILSLSAGFALSYHLARKNYTPIQALIQQFLDNADASSGRSTTGPLPVAQSPATAHAKSGKSLMPRGKNRWNNEDDLGFLSKALEGLLTRQTTLEQTVFTQKNFVRNDLLGMLVRGRAKQLADVEDMCRQIGIELLSDRCALVGIQVDPSSRPFFEEGQDDSGETALLVKFMLTSVVEELFEGHYRAYYLEWKGFSLALVSLAAKGAHGKTQSQEEKDIRDTLERVQGIFRERFCISLSLAVSSIRHRLDDLPLAIGEVEEIMETLSMYGESGVLMTSREQDTHEQDFRVGSFRSLQSLQRQVSDLVRKGEFGRIAHEVEQYIAQHLSDSSKASLQVSKLRMAGIVNLMMDTLFEMIDFSENEEWAQSNPLERLANVRSVQELSGEIDHICRELVAFSEKQRDEGLHVPEIQAYVEQHAYDPSLSVSRIADAFQLSLPYLSRLFKREYGTGLLEYIHCKRIAKAKTLLRETTLTVQQVSEQVGYGSRITLTRAFKRFEGMSPGEVRCQPPDGQKLQHLCKN